MENYKNLGLVSIIWLWVCLWFMIWHWRGNKSMTYSAHAAQTKQGIVYYFVTFSIHLVLFTIFAFKWLVPTLHLSSLFLPILVIAVVGQLLALLIPSTGGNMTKLHDITAYCMHMLLMPLSIIIAFSSTVSLVSRVAALIASAYMVTLWCLFVFVKKSKGYSLYLQTAYGLSFHIVILLATYVR